MAMGPDRAISLRMWKSRLREVRTAARVDEALQRSLGVEVDVDGTGRLRVVLKDEDGREVRRFEGDGGVIWQLGEEVGLWCLSARGNRRGMRSPWSYSTR